MKGRSDIVMFEVPERAPFGRSLRTSWSSLCAHVPCNGITPEGVRRFKLTASGCCKDGSSQLGHGEVKPEGAVSECRIRGVGKNHLPSTPHFLP